MKSLLSLLVLLSLAVSASAAPLRVFIRGGKKSHGPNAHEHERFLTDWKKLLTERGMTADGALDWPTAAQFAQTDVLIVHAQEGGNATEEQKKNLADFTRRGGGLVVIHAAAVSNDPAWWKSVIGGTWVPGKTKWKEGPMDLYYTENQQLGGGHPITRGASNFHIDDEIYYDMDIAPEVKVLATAYTPNVREGKKQADGGKAHIFDIQPQMWAYEKDNYRAFVTIPGHLYFTFAKPHYRALLLRGIAWAGQRANLDEACKPDELAALTYPEGGPQRPADTLKALEVHPDFTLTLVASEPLINKPMNFDWAPDGSLWVAETPEYPNGRRGMRPDYRGKEWKDHGGIDPTPGVQERKGIDKISRLTDTNGDGVMDKKEVFYEGLDLVTGLVFYKDGVIVTQAPDILFLRDTDGDGKADKVEKLYGGLGASDTHAVINNPRWGWDGWIYATHGYSGSNKVVNAKGEKMPTIGSGVVRFKPDGSVIEQYSSKGGNTWGLTITGDNRVMWTQPTSGELLMQTVLPEDALARGKVGKTASYHVIEPAKKTFPAMTWEQQAYRQIDWVGSFTAAAGCVIYDGGSWPAEYNGDYFTTEPTINIVHHARLTPQGSSYTFNKLPGREETEFIRSKDMWWRPIEVRTGPDGAVYVGDFYNQAVIHNDTRGPDHNKVNAAVRPDRDHYFGRIWRLDHKDAKKLDVPDLSKAGVPELAKALEHPNRVVRMTASRLLVEKTQTSPTRRGNKNPVGDEIARCLSSWSNMTPAAKVAVMWTLHGANVSQVGVMNLALSDPDGSVRRNAALIAEDDAADPMPIAVKVESVIADPDPQVRVAALRALSAGGFDDNVAKKLIGAWLMFDDDFQRSAAVGAAAQNSVASIAAALDAVGRVGVPPAGSGVSPEPSNVGNREPASDAPRTSEGPRGTPTLPDANSLAPLVAAMTQNITRPEDAANLVIALADKPAAADPLKRSILDSLGKSLKDAPAMTPELSAALGKLLASGASGSALPLAAQWDKAGALKPAIDQLTRDLFAKLGAGTDDARLTAAQALLGLRSANPEALPAVIKLATGKITPAFQRSLVLALGETGDPAVGTALAVAFGSLAPEAQGAAFEAMVKRSDTALALLEAAAAKKVDITGLGPANLARLRTFPDKAVSARANAVLDELLGPAMKAKNEVIAKLSAEVGKPGDAAKGKVLFAQACAICHQFGEVGADVGPGLTGMGAHGPAELLTAIVDPNREVDPSFVAWNIETKDGAFHSGVIARENPSSLVLKSLAGQEEIKVAEIKSRVNTGRSLMPEGFESLGAETLRDILAYMVGADGARFRMLDLSKAFTATSAHGFYADQKDRPENFRFVKMGMLNLGGIPFNLVAPEKSPTGNNVIQLKGGPARVYAQTMPRTVEVPGGGFKANRLHFLGNVAGWGFPFSQETDVALKATVQFVGGASETLEFRNGVEIADYIARNDVPGSKFAEGVTKNAQVRWNSKPLKTTAPIEKIILESAGTIVAPTTFAITAELADANAPLQSGHGITQSTIAEPIWAPRETGIEVIVPSIINNPIFSLRKASGAVEDEPGFKPQFTDPVPQPPATRPASGPRVLLVGGGSSHDFVKFFGASDKVTLTPVVGWVDFTQNLNGIAPILKSIDVLVLSANQPISSETKKALIDFANAGKGIVALHPGLWYAWKNFPEWHREIIGGGTKGHDALGPYTVTITDPASPITKGVPATFEITDELYNYIAEPAATPIEVLATATSLKSGKSFPQVFIVKHPKAKIVGLTLGHDARAHDLPAYQVLLKNAVLWTGK